MAQGSVVDQMLQGLGHAVTDVREKLVEEAWFGRTTAAQERMSEDIGQAVAAPRDAVDDFVQRFWNGADAQRVPRKSFDEMLAEHARGQGIAPDPEIDRDREIER